MEKILKEFLAESLEKIEAAQLTRKTICYDKANLINFTSNDYLGLGQKKISTLSEPISIGSTGSRITTGTNPIHEELETYLANWKGTEAALSFNCGYMANLGTLGALLNPRDVVFSDELNHSCINEGIRLSGAKKFFYKHNDISHLEELLKKHRHQSQKAIVVTNTVFSMDGDRARIKEIVALKDKYEFSIYVDEAHSSGIYGSNGSGLIKELIEQGEIKKGDIEIHMGTFSKAVAVEGGYIAGSRDLINFLKNTAKSFIFTTAFSPLIAKLILENLKEIISDSTPRMKLHKNIKYFREKLLASKIKKENWSNESTSIFAIRVGDTVATLNAATALLKEGLLVMPIRKPSVPFPRLRVTLSAMHSEDDIDKLIDCLLKLISQRGQIETNSSL